MKKEIRNLPSKQTEVRANSEKRTIEGYAIIFNVRSALIDGNFTEIIMPSAVDGVIPNSDVLALLNHDKNKGLLARSRFGKGTLSLEVDNKGVRYNFEAPKTPLGEETLEGVKRGDIANSSFSFTVAENGQVWERQSDGKYQRTITQFDRIFDVSPVYDPEAYTDATVAVRSLQEFRDNEGKTDPPVVPPVVPPAVPPVVPPVEEEKVTLDELSRHYDILRDKMKSY